MNEIHRSFVYENLMPRIISPMAPDIINLQLAFRDHIIDQGENSLQSEEMAGNQIDHLCRSLEQHLSYWDAQGIPHPFTQTDQKNIFLTWRHAQFYKYSGLSQTIDANFCEIFEYIQSLDGSQFLVVCALWLKCAGFHKIYICDARGDKGVDILGLLEEGALRSLVMVIQAKTSKEPITQGQVFNEYRKYLMLPDTSKYIQYRRALEMDTRVDGSSWTYTILANNSFNYHAQKTSRECGILLRSIHQITFLLTGKYTKNQIEKEVMHLSPSVRADLESNFYSKLSI